MRLTEQKQVVTMARQDLKKYCMRPHVLTIDIIYDPVLACVICSCERFTAYLLLALHGS
jgi:hypothetical protein